MSANALHLYGVIVPYAAIATLLVAWLACAAHLAARLGRIALPPGRAAALALVLGFIVFAFIYACAFDRAHMDRAEDVWYLWVLALFSWASLLALALRFRWGLAMLGRVLTAEQRVEAAEAQAERERTSVAAVLEDVPVAFAGYDLQTHRYLWMNRAGRTIYGDGDPDGPVDLYAEPYYHFLAPGEVERAAAITAARTRAIVTEGHDPGYQGLVLKLANGRHIEFHQAERPGGLQGVVQFVDVTARVAREAAEREAREREHRSDIAAAELKATSEALGKRLKKDRGEADG